MTVQIKKWGNSSAVRIPADVLAAAKMRVDDSVHVREEAGRLIIERVSRHRYNLDEMLDSITPDMLHDEVDWGLPVGKEIW